MKKLRKSEKNHYITYSHKKNQDLTKKITKLGKKKLRKSMKIQDIIKDQDLTKKIKTRT